MIRIRMNIIQNILFYNALGGLSENFHLVFLYNLDKMSVNDCSRIVNDHSRFYRDFLKKAWVSPYAS